MTMLTQAEKRRLRNASPVAVVPVSLPVPEVVVVRAVNPQSLNRTDRIAFGPEARILLPHLASIWDNGK